MIIEMIYLLVALYMLFHTTGYWAREPVFCLVAAIVAFLIAPLMASIEVGGATYNYYYLMYLWLGLGILDALLFLYFSFEAMGRGVKKIVER